MTVTVTVDTNAKENALCERLIEYGVETVERATLKTGDLVLRDDVTGRMFLVERKSTDNLVSDIATRRFEAQRSRLAGEQAEHEHVTSIVLLHGIRPPIDDCKVGYGYVTGRSFHSSTLTTQFCYGVSVVHAGNTLDAAAQWIALLVKNLAAGKLDEARAVVDRDAPPPVSLDRKSSRDAEPREILVKLLACMPGSSLKKARALVTAFPTLTVLCDASVSELASVDVGGRKLGKALAMRFKSMV